MALALWVPGLAWLTGIEIAAATAVPAMAASLWIGGKAVRRVEGLTGDVMGATTIISEIIMLMCWTTAGIYAGGMSMHPQTGSLISFGTPRL